MDYRYFLLTAHYLKIQNFTFEALGAAKNALYNLIKKAKQHFEGKNENIDLSQYEKRFLSAVNDDLNISLALGIVWDMIKLTENKNIYKMLLKFDNVLGLNIEKHILAEEENDEIPDEIKELAQKRWFAKLNKDFQTADMLRQLILKKGFVIKDEKEKYTISKQ